jgi:hypothetical protein
MSEKAEKLIQQIATPLIVALIIAVACTFISYKVLEDRHNRTEQRLAELEANRKEDRKLTDDLLYRFDIRLAGIERDLSRLLGKMEARELK